MYRSVRSRVNEAEAQIAARVRPPTSLRQSQGRRTSRAGKLVELTDTALVGGEIRYAKSDDVNIAYTVEGNGATDLVLVPGWVSHLEMTREEPRGARYLDRLASFSRLIRFDKRGTGLSDRVLSVDLDTRMDDVRAVMDACGSRRAAVYGVSEAGPMSILFAATYPDRVSALLLYGAFARRVRDSGYPWGTTPGQRDAYADWLEANWGTGADLRNRAPNADPEYAAWYRRYERSAASPAAAAAITRMNARIDVRDILPAIRVPTLVLHRTDDPIIEVGHGRHLAANISGARFVELAGGDHVPWLGDSDAIVDEIEEFLTGIRPTHHDERVLCTLVFFDIVGSTEIVQRLGDHAWRELSDRFRSMVREQLARYRGRDLDWAGDGCLAMFDGPARAIRCASEVRHVTSDLGVRIRAGIHTGEVERSNGGVRGIAVHVASRIAAAAEADEVLVSRTTRDLIEGSGLELVDRGERSLKGLTEPKRVFSVR